MSCNRDRHNPLSAHVPVAYLWKIKCSIKICTEFRSDIFKVDDYLKINQIRTRFVCVLINKSLYETHDWLNFTVK